MKRKLRPAVASITICLLLSVLYLSGAPLLKQFAHEQGCVRSLGFWPIGRCLRSCKYRTDFLDTRSRTQRYMTATWLTGIRFCVGLFQAPAKPNPAVPAKPSHCERRVWDSDLCTQAISLSEIRNDCFGKRFPSAGKSSRGGGSPHSAAVPLIGLQGKLDDQDTSIAATRIPPVNEVQEESEVLESQESHVSKLDADVNIPLAEESIISKLLGACGSSMAGWSIWDVRQKLEQHFSASLRYDMVVASVRAYAERARRSLFYGSRGGTDHAQPNPDQKLARSEKFESSYFGSLFGRAADRLSCPASLVAEQAGTILSKIDHWGAVAVREWLRRLVFPTTVVSPSGRFRRTAELVAWGSTRDVYFAFDMRSGARVCWFEKLPENSERSSEKCLQRHLDLLRSLEHPHILRLLEGWIERDRFGCAVDIRYITPWLAGGDLAGNLRRMGPVPLELVYRWGVQILEAVVFLHSRSPPIIHRDLKPENILIDHRTGEIILADFHRSERLGELDPCVEASHGTPEYMPPELFEGITTVKSDVYAYGMTLLHILTLEKPYSECSSWDELAERVLAGSPPDSLERIPPGSLRDIIVDCLQPVERRPSSFELLERFRDLALNESVKMAET